MPENDLPPKEYAAEAGHVRSAEVDSVGRTDRWRRAATWRWPSINALLPPGGRGRLAVATGLICCLGFAAVSESRAAVGPPSDRVETVAAQAAAATRAGDQAASRSTDRAAVPSQQATTTQPKPTPAKPAKPKPVAGLTQAQMDNANIIVRVGLRNKMPRKALVIAIATAMQESRLYNLASEVLPESKRYPHQGTGWDHDSVGLFQQRTSTGWGPVRSLMQPEFAATQFYNALRRVSGWQWMPVTVAAQSVQGSAFPGAYAKHEWRATVVVDALT